MLDQSGRVCTSHNREEGRVRTRKVLQPSGLVPRAGEMKRLVVIAAAFALAACNGGTVDNQALSKDASTLDSIACEGALLAHDVAHGRTTTFFAREQAEELRNQSSNFADALSRRKTLPHIKRKVREKANDAARLAAILQRLHDHPGERTVGAAIERTLKTMGSCP